MSTGAEAFEPWAWQTSATVLAPAEALDASSSARAQPQRPWDQEQQEQLQASIRTSPVGIESLRLAHQLLQQQDPRVLQHHADALRRDLVGETVTYVRNRNLNFTNHCIQHCSFCAFRRDPDQPGAYWHSIEELQRRAAEAAGLGASELCLQGGLNAAAQINGSLLAYYAALLGALRDAAPGLHLHAFSPQELLFIAQQDGIPLQAVLETLASAGLNSVPGTAAEVLSESVRQRLCPEKLTAREWCAVVLQVHRSGLPSTSTLMAGHLESPADRAAHLLTLVALQQEARQHQGAGFTEFVLLPFIGAQAPAPLRQRVGRDQPDREAMLVLTAQSRLVLGEWIINHQPSWVKLTLAGATEALRWGCNDLGGTLMEESITSMAGAQGGTSQSAAALEAAAHSLHRPVRERTTLYGVRS